MSAGRSMWAGRGFMAALAAGMAALTAVILVSLPLKSPHDALMNAGTIAIAGSAVALCLSYAWQRLVASRDDAAALRMFAIINVAAFAVSAVGAFVIQSAADLEHTVSFVVPLAAIQFAGTLALTPAFHRFRRVALLSAIVFVIAVIGLGASLASHGDQESGHLSIPARSS